MEERYTMVSSIWEMFGSAGFVSASLRTSSEVKCIMGLQYGAIVCRFFSDYFIGQLFILKGHILGQPSWEIELLKSWSRPLSCFKATLSHFHAGSTFKLGKALLSSFGRSTKATCLGTLQSQFSWHHSFIYSFIHWCTHSFKVYPLLLLCCSFWLWALTLSLLRCPCLAPIPAEVETYWFPFWCFDIQWCCTVLDIFFDSVFSFELSVSNCLQGQDQWPVQLLALYSSTLAQLSQKW